MGFKVRDRPRGPIRAVRWFREPSTRPASAVMAAFARNPRPNSSESTPEARAGAIAPIPFSRCQTAQAYAADLVPAARLRPGFETLTHPDEGWAERRQAPGCI